MKESQEFLRRLQNDTISAVENDKKMMVWGGEWSPCPFWNWKVFERGNLL